MIDCFKNGKRKTEKPKAPLRGATSAVKQTNHEPCEAIRRRCEQSEANRTSAAKRVKKEKIRTFFYKMCLTVSFRANGYSGLGVETRLKDEIAQSRFLVKLYLSPLKSE